MSRTALRTGAAIVVMGLAVSACGTNKSKSDTSGPATTVASASCATGTSGGVPITYNQAKDGGCTDKFTWSKYCDTTTGRLKVPGDGPECVPAFSGDNGGATSPGVTATSIKVARYVAKTDPATDAFLNSIGARDEPAAVDETYKNFLDIYNTMAEFYGRKIEVVPLQGTGTATDAVAARADALKAKELGVFAVIGGPAQTRAFSEELARQGIINIGGGTATGDFIEKHTPYVWGIGPSPEQTASRTTEFVQKQLVGKKAEFAGDALKDKTRSFVLLTYDDAESNFKQPWDNWLKDLQSKGVPVAPQRIVFTLDLARAAEDTQVVVQKLRDVNATTIIFTGDPIMPSYFTKEMTKQGYFPEWVLSGTVYADTTVLARGYDSEQWKHTMGISLVPVRVPNAEGGSTVLYKWWTGDADIPAKNTGGPILNNVGILIAGIHYAGAKLTPETFRAGIFARPLPKRNASDIRATVTWGRSDVWSNGPDYAGLDDVSIIWWDPNAKGEDETGTDGTGEYRYIDGGARYLPGKIPTEPLPLFDASKAVTYYTDDTNAPDGTQPVPDYFKIDATKYQRP